MNHVILRRWAVPVVLASFCAAVAAFTPVLWLRSLLAVLSFLGAMGWIFAATKQLLQGSARAESLARVWEEEKGRRRHLETLVAELVQSLIHWGDKGFEESLAGWHCELGGEIRLLLEDASLVREDLAAIVPEVTAVLAVDGPAAREKVREIASLAEEAAGKAVAVGEEMRALHERAMGFHHALRTFHAELAEMAQAHRREVEEEDSALAAGEEALKKWHGPMEELGQAVQSATDLAEQARILGVNASIEALRSGESGRGFSLVAEEAERLSERMLRLAHQIAVQIEATERMIRQTAQEIEKARTSLGRLMVLGRRLGERSQDAPEDPGVAPSSAADLAVLAVRAREELEALDGVLGDLLARLGTMPAEEARATAEKVLEAIGRAARKMDSFLAHLEKARGIGVRLAAAEAAARELGAALEGPGSPSY